MENVVYGISVLLLTLIAAVQEKIAFHSMDLLSGVNRRKYAVLLMGGMFNIIWPVYAVMIGMSILTFLTGLYAAFLIVIIPLYRENSIWIRFRQMKFVVLTAVTLVGLGGACLFGSDVRQVSSIREVRLYVLLVAKSAELVYLVVHQRYFAENFKGLERDNRKIGMFQLFLLSCLVYIYADGVLAIFDFGGDFVPALMISGNILILILMFLFYQFDYAMEQKEYLEHEHEQLTAEKARELWKAEHLKTMAERDALTNAYSRGYAVQRTEFFEKEKIPFLVVYIDMDRMKEINDSRGHQAGDIYLKNFVSSFSDKLRADDFLARIGGDEFLVVMCGCSQEDGKRRMEEISLLLTEYSFSYGIASGQENVEAMIAEADRCMYNSKKQKSIEARRGIR